jgi:transcriptional regulator with XRE-family HTH domain
MNLEKMVIDNIRRIRIRRGISQEKLAEACETSTSYIGLMETYRNVPKLSTIERIAEALGVSPLVFFYSPDREVEGETTEAEIEMKKKLIVEALERELDDILRR